MPNLTLDGLEKALRALHPTESDRGPAFSVTYNSQLPKQPNAPDDKFDLFMLLPFNRWDQEHNTSKNVMADSFKEVVDVGLSAAADNIVLIDLALLNQPSPEFMHEQGMIQHLADKLKQDHIKDKKVIIRLLVGCSEQDQRRDNFLARANGDQRLTVYERLFWKDGNIIEHKDATLLLGYYNPTLRLSKERPKDGSLMDGLEKILAPFETVKLPPDATSKTVVPVPDAPRLSPAPGPATTPWERFKAKINGVLDMLGKASKYALAGVAFVQTLAKSFKDFEDYARKNDLPSMSWNHSKYLAVNGKAMMTGGFNYWDDYLRSKEIESATNTDYKVLIDFGIKMQGDVAISVHSFADDMWRSLAAMNPSFDARSMGWKANLSVPALKFEPAGKGDIMASVGLFEKKPLAKSGAIKVLSTARIGEMKLDDYVYPSQLLDAFRDILLNTAWHYNESFPAEGVQGNAVYDAVSMANLFWNLPSSPGIPGLVNTHPAAWASKYARLFAIENATKSVHMTAQSLVEEFGDGNWKSGDPEHPGIVDKINGELKFPKEKQWDGVLWPYDLLVAMSNALSTLAKLPGPAAGDVPTGAAIFIVLSSHDENYGDRITKTQFRSRLGEVMKYMASTKKLTVSTRVADVDSIVQDRLRIKRVRNGDKHQRMHAKTMCVDRSLLYVGSDNPYPHYNAEFGCWVEDEGYVGAWFKDFYDGAWKGGNLTVD